MKVKPKVDTVIQFSGLKPGRYDYHFALDGDFFSGFENEELREGNVDFEVVLEKRERMLLFHFSFKGEMKSVCDRCLGDIEVPVQGEETLCVKFSDTETCDDDDVVFLPENAFQIDLAQWMYEYVAVSMPMQRVHKEGECNAEMLKYITHERKEQEDQQEEGQEPDPRWDALKTFLEK